MGERGERGHDGGEHGGVVVDLVLREDVVGQPLRELAGVDEGRAQIVVPARGGEAALDGGALGAGIGGALAVGVDDHRCGAAGDASTRRSVSGSWVTLARQRSR